MPRFPTRPALALLGVLAFLCLAACAPTATVSVSPTATATTPPTPAGTPSATPTITPAPSAGWAVYRDSRYGFQVPLPPGWRPASFDWTNPSGPNYYIVQFFSPGSHGQPGVGATSMEPQLIQVAVVTSGPYTSLAQNTGLTREPVAVALGSEQVPLYDRGELGPGSEVLRLAEMTFRRYPMTFEMHYLAYSAWDPAVARTDISLFLAMLQGFGPVSN